MIDADLCSHKRSVAYWCESIVNTNKSMAFYAKKRSSDGDFVSMGIDCSLTANGSYYLKTDSNPPYSLGMKGIDGIDGIM